MPTLFHTVRSLNTDYSGARTDDGAYAARRAAGQFISFLPFMRSLHAACDVTPQAGSAMSLMHSNVPHVRLTIGSNELVYNSSNVSVKQASLR